MNRAHLMPIAMQVDARAAAPTVVDCDELVDGG